MAAACAFASYLHEKDALLPSCLHHFLDLRRIHAHGLLTKDMLPRLDEEEGVWKVPRMHRSYVHNVCKNKASLRKGSQLEPSSDIKCLVPSNKSIIRQFASNSLNLMDSDPDGKGSTNSSSLFAFLSH